MSKAPTAAAESWATSPAVRRSMQSNKSRDTKPELAVRRLLHAAGLRYRVCARPLPELRRTADIVFRPARVAVEVRGCFWHGCPEHYRGPTANGGYWAEKIARNQARDAETAARWAAAGWTLVEIWEHENPEQAAARVVSVLAERRALTPRRRAPSGAVALRRDPSPRDRSAGDQSAGDRP